MFSLLHSTKLMRKPLLSYGGAALRNGRMKRGVLMMTPIGFFVTVDITQSAVVAVGRAAALVDIQVVMGLQVDMSCSVMIHLRGSVIDQILDKTLEEQNLASESFWSEVRNIWYEVAQ